MMAIIFFATTVIAAIGWLCSWVGAAALVKYMADKHYTPPSEEEIKACSAYILKKTLHIR